MREKSAHQSTSLFRLRLDSPKRLAQHLSHLEYAFNRREVKNNLEFILALFLKTVRGNLNHTYLGEIFGLEESED